MYGPRLDIIIREPGAGKSVFLGAIAMMLGQRSDVKAIRDGAEKDRFTCTGLTRNDREARGEIDLHALHQSKILYYD